MRIILFLILFTCCAGQLYAQYTTDKVVGEKHKDLSDSLKKLTYEHILPIWGQKVMEKGFEIPKSAGIASQHSCVIILRITWKQELILTKM